MKKLMIVVAALLMVGCKAQMNVDQQIAAEKYCTERGMELVPLTTMWDYGKTMDFGCRKKGDYAYAVVPDYVTRPKR